jgi:hypothetical protein
MLLSALPHQALHVWEIRSFPLGLVKPVFRQFGSRTGAQPDPYRSQHQG